MLRVLLTLGLWLAGSGFASAQWIGPPNAVMCNKAANFTGLSVATQLIGAVPKTIIFVCGWELTNSAGGGTVGINFGTQTTTPCDTNSVVIAPAINISTNAVVDHQQYASFSSASGQALCVTPNAATITGIVYYTQVQNTQ